MVQRADAVALADAAGTDSIQDPLAALDEARALGLLKIGADLQVLNFPYPLLRAAVYASLTATERDLVLVLRRNPKLRDLLRRQPPSQATVHGVEVYFSPGSSDLPNA